MYISLESALLTYSYLSSHDSCHHRLTAELAIRRTLLCFVGMRSPIASLLAVIEMQLRAEPRVRDVGNQLDTQYRLKIIITASADCVPLSEGND